MATNKPDSSANPSASLRTGLTRRQFLHAALGVASGGAMLTPACKYQTQLFLLSRPPKEAKEPQPAWQDSQVQSYRPLGRTGMRMSDISFGCGGLGDAQVVRRALERGINYFDTSPDYSRAGSERVLGEGITGHPRDKLFIVSKFCTPYGHLRKGTPVSDFIAAVEGSLSRIGTDYLDLVHIHAVNSVERLMSANLHEAFDRLREAGKARFLGVSSHSPNLEAVMRHAVDCGRFDAIMVAYNFRNWPDLTSIFRDARARGVGVVAMKTLKGARHTVLSDFTPTERESFSQAAFKWVLSNPNVSGLVVTINRLSQIDEYLHASGQAVQPEDIALLEKYDRLIAQDYCRPGCGECLSSCPYGVPVNDVFRHAMYYENYGQQSLAMEEYNTLPASTNASQCLCCPAPCQPACPFGIPIKEKMLRFHPLLTMNTKDGVSADDPHAGDTSRS